MTQIAISNARGFLGEMLARVALNRGHEVFGLVFGSAQSGYNLKGVRYVSLDESQGQGAGDLATQTLKDVEILIHAGGPYTLDVSLLEADPALCSQLFKAKGMPFKSGNKDATAAQFSLNLQCFYSHITGVVLGLALQLPNLKHLVGLSSLSVGAKYSPMAKMNLQNKLKQRSSIKRKAVNLLEAPLGGESHPGSLAAERSPMTHPLGLAALAFERSFDGSQGWKSPSLRKTIVRLGTLIGDSTTGVYPNLNGLYSVVPFCHQLARGGSFLNRFPFLPLPFHERSRLCLLPVDLAAEALLDLAFVSFAETNRTPSISPSLSQDNHQTHYRHLADPERDLSVRRFFAANLRHSGLEIPPLAIGETPLLEPLYQKLGLNTEFLKLMSFDVPCSTEAFKTDVPGFKLKPIVEYYPTLINYAQKHLLHKKPQPGIVL